MKKEIQTSGDEKIHKLWHWFFMVCRGIKSNDAIETQMFYCQICGFEKRIIRRIQTYGMKGPT